MRERVVQPNDSGSGRQPSDAGREAVSRRNREIAPGRRQISEAIGQKVLHGFLQNRHQTLMPLSISLGRIADAERAAIARFAAVAVRAGSADAALEPVRACLIGFAADAEMLAAFEAALQSPPPLDAALGGLTDPEVALIAFILCLVAARRAGPAAGAFADYVALHRGLPTAAVRAAERRYRT
ncbi:hypothetical protein MRF4_19340 [Methylobacterium radiotolerans]